MHRSFSNIIGRKTWPIRCREIAWRSSSWNRIYNKKKSLTVSEVATEQDSEQLQEKEKPAEIQALIEVSHLESVQISHTLPEEVPGQFEAGKLPGEVQAGVKFSTKKPLIISEVSVEQTSGDMKVEKPQSVTAGVDLTLKETISISETMAEIKPDEFVSQELPAGVSAEGKFVSKQTVSVEEVVTELCTSDLKTPKRPLSKHLDFEVISSDSLNVSEAFVGDQPQELVQTKLPNGELAEMNVPYLETCSISEITSADFPSELPLAKKPTEVIANTKLLPKDSLHVSEVTTETTTADLLLKSPESASASVSYIKKQSFSVQETELEEIYEDLTEDKKPIEKKANFNFTKEDHLNVSEIISQTSASNLEVAQLPTGLTAQFSVTAAQHVSISEITPENKVSDFESQDTAIHGVAEIGLSPHETLVVSEVIDEIRAASLEKDLKPEETSAKVKFIPEEHIAISDVAMQAVTADLVEDKKPEGQQVQFEISSQHTLSVSEIQAEEKENVFKADEIPGSRKVDFEIPSDVVAQVSEVLTQDSFKELTEEMPGTEIADVSIPFDLAMQVLEVLENSSFSDMKPDEMPGTKLANVSIPSELATQVYEVLANSSIGDLQISERPGSRQAEIEISPKIPAEVSIVTSYSSTKEFKSGELPGTQELSYTVPSDVAMQVMEVTTQGSLQEITEESPSMAKAEVSLPSDLATQVLEILSNHSVAYLTADTIPGARKVDVILPSEIAMQVYETLAHSSITDMMPMEKPSSLTAAVGVVEKVSVQVSEVTPGQETGDMEIVQPLEKKAKESFRPELPTAQTSETVQVLENVEEQKPIEDTIEKAVLKIKKKPKTEDKPEEIIIERKPSIKDEQPEEITEEVSLKITEKPIDEEKPEEITIERKHSLKEEKVEVVDKKIKLKKKPKEEEKPDEITIERKPSIKEEKTEELLEKVALKLKKKTEQETKPEEAKIEIKPLIKEETEEITDKAVVKLKRKPKEEKEEKPTELIVERKPSLKEEKPEDATDSTVITLKKKPLEEDKPEKVVIQERKPSLKDEKLSEVTEKTVVKLKKEPKATEAPEEITVERKLSLKEEVREEHIEKAVVKIKKKTKEEEKPAEITIERKPSLKEEKPEEISEKAVIKIKKKPKEEEKPTEMVLERKPSLKDEKPEEISEKAIIKIKKKPKEEEKPSEVTIERKLSLKEEKTEDISEKAIIQVKKKPIEEEKPTEVVIERKPSLKEEKPEEISEKAVIKIKKKPKEEEAPTEITVERKPSLKEEKPEEISEKAVIKIKKRPKDEEKPTEMIIERKLSLKEDKPEEICEKAILKIKKKPIEEEKPVAITIERKPSLKPEEKPEEVSEAAIVKIKKKPIEEEKPTEITLERKLSLKEEKPEEISEKAIIKIKKKPKEEEKPEDTVIKMSLKEEIKHEKTEVKEEVKTAKIKLKKKVPVKEEDNIPSGEFKIPLKPEEDVTDTADEEKTELFSLTIAPKAKEFTSTEEFAEVVIPSQETIKYSVEEQTVDLTVKKIVEVDIEKETPLSSTISEKSPEKVIEEKVKIKRKPKVKEEPTTEQEAEFKVTMPVDKPTEEKIEEVVEQFVVKTHKKEDSVITEEHAEEVLKVIPEKQDYVVTEEVAEVTVKKPVVEEDTEVKLVAKKKKPKIVEETSPSVFKIPVVEKPENQQEVVPVKEVEETFSVEVPKKEPKKVVETVEDVIKLSLGEETKKVVEEKAEITVKKEVIVEKSPEPETTVIKKKKPKLKKEKSESPEETFAIPLKPEEEEKPEEAPVEEKFTVGLKKPKQVVKTVEEESVKLTIENQEVREYKKEEVVADLTVKKVEITEKPIEEEVAVTKRLKKKPVPKVTDEPIEETFAIPLKKEPEEEDTVQLVEEKFSVKLPEKEKEREAKFEEESFKLVIEKEKPKPVEEVAADEATVVIKPKEEPKVLLEKEEKTTLKLKPKKRDLKEEKPEDIQETFKVPLKKETVEEDKPVEETFAVSLPKSIKPVVEEEAKLVVQPEKPQEYKISEETTEITVKKVVEEKEETVRIKKSKDVKKKEDIVQEEFKITQKPVDVEEPEPTSFKVDLPKKPTPKVKDVPEEEDSLQLKLPEGTPKPKVEEEFAEVTVRKKIEEEPEKVTTQEEQRVSIKKPKKKTEVDNAPVDESFTVRRKESISESKTETYEDVEETFAIKTTPKKKKKSVPSDEESLSISLPSDKPKPKIEEEFAEVTVKKKPEEVPEKVITQEEQRVSIKKPKKKTEVESATVDESFTVRRKESVAETVTEQFEDVEETFAIKTAPKKKKSVPSDEESLSISLPSDKPKPKIEEEFAEVTVKKKADEEQRVSIKKPKKKTEVESVAVDESFTVRRKESVTEQFEDVEETFAIKKVPKKKKSVPSDEESLSISLPSDKPKPKIEEEFAEVTVKKKADEEQKVSIKKPKKKTEVESASVDESFTVRRKESVVETKSETFEDVEETFAIKTAPKKKKTTLPSDEEESLSISLSSEKTDDKVEEISEEAKITMTKHKEEVEEIEEITETIEYVAITSYISEKPDTLPLVEGERVILIEKTKQDWWFVRKTVTNERGFVPADVLQDSATYTHYLKDTLSKKIEKLPVLRKPKPGEKATAPKFVQKLKPLTVVDGDIAELTCQVSGSPRPTITWFKQTQIIKPSVEFQIFYDDDYVTTLIIREIFPEDAGTYTVVAKNSAGVATTTAELIVEAPLSEHGTDLYPSSRASLSRQSSLTDILEGLFPVFSEKPKDKTVDEGKPVELVCKVSGIPEPTITWLRNQKPLKESDRIEIKTVSEDLEITTQTVIIKSAKPEDAGTYEIIAENREGKSVISLILNVTEKPKKPKDEPPVFIQTYSDTTCTEKDTVSLTVKVQGTPPPEVTWYKNGKEIKPSKTLKPTATDNVHTLVITESKKDDSGEYKCVAKNPKGKVEHISKVTVQKKGVDFVDKLYDSEVKERETAIFSVELTHPDAEVTWHKDGEQIKPSDRVKFVEDDSTRKLVIENAGVNDEGEYTCVLGEKECTAELVVIEMPADFKGDMKDVTVATEQNASFDVELTKGDARARWFKDGEEIDFSDHVMLKIDGKRQKLIIYNANFEDVGTYTCVVGNKKKSAKLKVEAPTVEFTAKLPEKMTVPQDTDVTFTVELSRKDVPVQWLKNGKLVPEKEKDKFKFIKDRNVYKLVVQSAQKDDQAEYSCVAGNVKSTTKLQVQEAHAEFTLKLRDVIVRESDTATLLVEVTRETFEVRWMKDGQTLKPTDRFIMEREGCRRRLIIKDTSLDDRGMYTCVLEEKACSSTLTVEATPRVVSDKRHFKSKRGGNVVVDVEFVSLPPPKIEWFYKGKSISPDKKRTIENYGNKTVLTIKKVDDTDVSDYTLKLTNKCGESKTDFTVSIIDKPKAPGMPNASEISDDSLTLSWKVPENDGGSPITNYIIEYHDRNTLRWSTYNEKFTIDKPFTKIEKLKPDEEYMFRVIAVNEVGKSDPSPGTKYVRVQSPKGGEPPAVVEHLKPVTCGLRKPAKLSCRITGQPPPTIKWFKNGKDLLIVKNIKTTYENQIATMEITDSTEKSAGKYTCKATNHLGTCETSSELKIQEPPLAIFDEKMKNVRLKSFNEYVLDVKVSGYPLPEIVWLKNGKVLESSKHTLVQIRDDSTTITIRSTENTDSGVYTLQLTNPADTVKYDFRLYVLDKPLPPEGPIAFHKIEKNSVTIGWKPPIVGASEVVSYIVEKCEIRRKIWMEVTTVTSDVLLQEIQDLSEGIEYAFRVIATNEYGRSEPLTSDPVTPRSLFDKPHAPKGPFTTSNMTDTSFTLSWLAPDNDGGSPIIEYIVERKEATRKAWQRVATTDGKSLSMEVTGLKKDTAYHFRVCCRNEIGQSPYFSPEETITPGLKISPPSSPVGPLVVSNMTNKTLTLSWKPPATTGGAELTAYIVEKRESTKKAWNRLETLAPHIRSYTVHNLTHTKEYFFRVFAENPAGLSPPLETESPVKLTSTAERPSPPTAPLEKVVTGPSSIMLAWGRPETDGGSPIKGYTVALRNVRRIMWMEVGQVDGETQKIQIKDLQEGAEYMVRIMARNEVGISDPLEPEEHVKVIRPEGFKESDKPDVDEKTISVSYSTETSSSWMREANVEPMLRSYTKHILAGRNEYFFRIWHLAETLSK